MTLTAGSISDQYWQLFWLILMWYSNQRPSFLTLLSKSVHISLLFQLLLHVNILLTTLFPAQCCQLLVIIIYPCDTTTPSLHSSNQKSGQSANVLLFFDNSHYKPNSCGALWGKQIAAGLSNTLSPLSLHKRHKKTSVHDCQSPRKNFIDKRGIWGDRNPKRKE